jgi:signal transduction histidine kinase
LKTVTSTLIFRIQDDGQGMSKLPPGQRGLGLIGMAERANAAGGKIRMTNVPGHGVEIVVEAPVKGPSA